MMTTETPSMRMITFRRDFLMTPEVRRITLDNQNTRILPKETQLTRKKIQNNPWFRKVHSNITTTLSRKIPSNNLTRRE